MAGNKKVPLTLGIGGPVIGTASIDENGLMIGEIDDAEIAKNLFGQDMHLSIRTDGED